MDLKCQPSRESFEQPETERHSPITHRSMKNGMKRRVRIGIIASSARPLSCNSGKYQPLKRNKLMANK